MVNLVLSGLDKREAVAVSVIVPHASADTTNMERVVSNRLFSGPPQPFATNALQITDPQGNPTAGSS